MIRPELSFTNIPDAVRRTHRAGFCLMCERLAFRTESDARCHIGLIIRGYVKREGTFAIHPYRCPHRRGWHVGRDHRALRLCSRPVHPIPHEVPMDTLFELRDEKQIRDQAIEENRRRIHDVIMGKGPWPLNERQARLLEILRWRQGRAHAIGIAELMPRLKCGAREIKEAVRELVVTFRLPIVASRDAEGGGYFFATTAEERMTGSSDYLKEAAKLIQRALIIRSDQDVKVLLGQIELELKERS